MLSTGITYRKYGVFAHTAQPFFRQRYTRTAAVLHYVPEFDAVSFFLSGFAERYKVGTARGRFTFPTTITEYSISFRVKQSELGVRVGILRRVDLYRDGLSYG